MHPPNEFLVWTHKTPEVPHLKPTFLRGGQKCGNNEPPPPSFFCIYNHESFFPPILNRKSVSGSQLRGVCMGRSGMYAETIDTVFSRLFCYVVVFGDLSDTELSTLRGANGDVVTICLLGYESTFFCCL